MSYEQVVELTRELHAGGFENVVTTHLIDPKWRKDYRPGWATTDDVMWSVRLSGYLMPMPQIKKLIDICERHDMSFWMSPTYTNNDESTGGTEIYVRVGTPNSRRQTMG